MKKYIVIILIILVSYSIYGNGNKEVNQKSLIDFNYEVSIEGMTCTLCSIAVEKQLNDLDWINGIHGDHEKGIALLKVENELNISDMEKAIVPKLIEIGYKLIEIRKLPNG